MGDHHYTMQLLLTLKPTSLMRLEFVEVQAVDSYGKLVAFEYRVQHLSSIRLFTFMCSNSFPSGTYLESDKPTETWMSSAID